jgi:hypothetical protein
MEEAIRRRAYEIWEEEGQAGRPEDHWYRAERELADGSSDPLGATAAEAPPADAVKSAEAVDPQSSTAKSRARKRKA